MATPLQIIQNQISPDMIDLGAGDPSLARLPLDLLHTAVQTQIAQDDPSFLQYGTEQGDGYFRRALAQFLSRHYSCAVNPESLLITNGISQALAMVCTLFTQAGDTIFVEEPSYFLALKIFADHHLRVVSLDTDEHGLVIESLEEKLKSVRPRLLYLVPTFQNPTSHTLTQPRRERLVQIAQEYGFLLVADEVYQLLSYAGQPPRSFAAYPHLENVIALGSFSKILAPGLRLGWLHAHPRTIQRFIVSGQLDSGGGLNPFTSAIVRWAIESGDLDGNVEKLIDIYRARCHAMHSLLQLHLPDAKYLKPAGGFFFWVRLPGDMDATEIRGEARAMQVDFRPGQLFSSRGELKDYIRLCFVRYEEHEMQQGILRLQQCLERRKS